MLIIFWLAWMVMTPVSLEAMWKSQPRSTQPEIVSKDVKESHTTATSPCSLLSEQNISFYCVQVITEIKMWRKSCSGFRSRRAGLWPASDLPGVPGHCLDSMLDFAGKHSKSSSTWDKKGSGSWNSWAPEGLANHWSLRSLMIHMWNKWQCKS